MKTLVLLLLAVSLMAQTKSALGTVTRASAAEIEVKSENGEAIVVKVAAATAVKKVAPGQTDLSKAETVTAADVATGDRVLVSLGADAGAPALRIVVMPATDLAKRDAADRLDWQRRGVSGVVTAIGGNDVSVELRSLGAPLKFTVTVNGKTSFRKYAPDSVRFADAKASSVRELTVGDQIRARGQKSPDGLKVEAEEVVFGTFLSKAGTISALNPAAGEVTMKDLGNKNKPVTVKLTADSQVKRMPDMATLQGGGRGPGRGGGPDIGQILEGLPKLTLADLKQGEVVVVSAIGGARPDQITAITFLANAETLVQLAMAARGAGASGPAPSLAGLASSISNVGP